MNSGNLKYFYEPKPDLKEEEQAQWRDYTVYYTINSDSLNERYNYDIQKASDSARILILGDSFAFGQHVNTKNNWTELLEDKLNTLTKCNHIKKYEVINLGVRGYDIEYAIHRYNIRGRKYNPDIVLWYLVGNDFTIINEFLSPITKKIEQTLTERDYKEASLRGNFWLADTLGYEEYEKKYSKKFIYNYIHNLFQEFDFSPSTLIVITDENVNDEQKTILKSLIKEKNYNIELIEMVHLDRFPDSHPNVQSQELIAETLFSYLKKNYFITCEAFRP